LIISPYFPPSNAADMHRVRTSLCYFNEFGWAPEVVCIHELYSEMVQDPLLLKSIPSNVPVHKVNAFPKTLTSKVGLGSIAIRSLWFYKREVNRLLKKKSFNLVYFSTTQFPVCILGPYWKKKFGIPYIIDMQDPWHSDYYQDKPKALRPKKYWFSYRLNKYLEGLALKKVDGLISVSEAYITDLKNRYPEITAVPAATITFGGFSDDLKIATNGLTGASLLDPGSINLVYAGRGGADMHPALKVIFRALQAELKESPDLYRKLKLYFIGTSYAAAGTGEPSILPLARQYGLDLQVVEITDRVGYYQTLATLQLADALLMPGSDDPKYTASKIYPYLLTKKPLLAVFNRESSVIRIMKEYGVKSVFAYQSTDTSRIRLFFRQLAHGSLPAPVYNPDAIARYSARQMTLSQCKLFDRVIK